jgi:dipicolinate synthase subunit A
MQSILIAGGDMRQVRLAEMLRQRAYTVHTTGFEKLGTAEELPDTADWVFLPVPYRTPEGDIKAPFSNIKMKLDDIVSRYPQSAWLLGGADAQAQTLLAEKRVFDLLRDEAFLVYNAMLTAQGAVCAYLKDSETALYGARCVVTGYGRIAKLLCGLLKAHAARVIAVARRHSDLEVIRAEGMTAMHISALSKALKGAEVVFNTVPERIFGEAELASIPAHACVIELASPPYGLDIARAKEMGLSARIEAGLPGRYFPASAAGAMLRAFEREEGQHGTGR